MKRALASLAIVIAGCAPRLELRLPFEATTESLILAIDDPDGDLSVYALARDSLVERELAGSVVLTALLYDRSLEALELMPGLIPEALPGASGVALPDPVARYATSTSDGRAGEWQPIAVLGERLQSFRIARELPPPDPCAIDDRECAGTQGEVIGVASRGVSTCAVRADRTLWCWGLNGDGLAGVGDSIDRRAPANVEARIDWLSVDVTASHACAIGDPGSLFCWGGNAQGQLGTSTTAVPETYQPLEVGLDRDWASVDVGSSFTCATKLDQSLWCWGYGLLGRLGNGALTSRATPVQLPVPAGFVSVSAGSSGACAIRREGSLWCWGGNERGQLGSGLTRHEARPVQVGTSTAWRSVSVTDHACGIQSDGSLWCWGNNLSGQLGLGDLGAGTERRTPVRVGEDFDWSAVAAGLGATCALRTGGSLWCWGQAPETGASCEPAQSTRPAQVAAGRKWRAIAIATTSSAQVAVRCAIDEDGVLFCWGMNQEGQLGLGDDELSPRPAPVRVCF